MVLTVADLKKAFDGPDGSITVLDGVDLSLESGRSLAVTGESGSGKSTLLHVIAGLERADAGRIVVDGIELGELDDSERARLRRERIAVVFQQFNLVPSLTIAANVAFQSRLAGRHDPAREAELMERLGIASQAAKYPEALSGGQQQRAAIARALAAGPRLILADEPTGNLDEATADTVVDLMVDMVRASDAGLLFVTHSQRLAARLDARVHLSRGRIE